MSCLVAARRLVCGDGFDGPGWLHVDGPRVLERGRGEAPRPADLVLDTVIPGCLDPHVHGAVGVDFATPGTDPGPALQHHHRAGSTTLLASLATAPLNDTLRRLAELAPVVAAGDLAGLHLEGPWLAPAQRGAHHPALLRHPRRRDAEALLSAGSGTVRMVTLAPELPGAPDVVAHLVDAGVVVAIGHTGADTDTVRRCLDAGARVATHLFNGMPPLHHRRPGPVGVALDDQRVSVELIADGHHLHDTVLDLALGSTRGRACLVSDAMAATGLGDGDHVLAGSAVRVRDGVAELADGSSLAGSTTPLALAALRLLRRGTPVPDVVSLTSTVAARTLGLPVPHLQAGEPADLVEFRLSGGAGEATLGRTARRGSWLG
ncbi:N-acetylglucosamine-6-phosphate deacetylase [Kineococcus sp. SYSU DK002]|uniref:N-acetylglucosamine-6-phosphate deacetylase n=1 Tax=Kineococcus sp. SYSU DK002 TaxID=3383123 RepID=UPI003D7CD2AA